MTKCLLYYNNAVNTAATAAAAAAAAAARTFINLITFAPLDHPREDRKQGRPQAAPHRPPQLTFGVAALKEKFDEQVPDINACSSEGIALLKFLLVSACSLFKGICNTRP